MGLRGKSAFYLIDISKILVLFLAALLTTHLVVVQCLWR
jgi:hypothetical protein